MIQDILKRNRGRYIAALVSITINALFCVLFAPMMQILMNAVLSGDMGVLARAAVGSAAYLAIYAAQASLYSRLSNDYIRSVMNDLSRRTAEGIYRKKTQEFREKDEAYYQSIYQNDFESFRQNYLQAKFDFWEYICIFAMAVVCMFYTNWKMAILLLAISMVPSGFSVLYSKKLRPMQSVISEDGENMTTTLKSFLAGFSVVKSYQIAGRAVQEITLHSEKLQGAKRNYEVRSSETASYTAAMVTLVMVCICVAGGYLSITGEMDYGAILAFIQLTNNVSSPIQNIFVQYNRFTGCQDIMKKIDQIAVSAADGGGETEVGEIASIEYRNVSFRYGDTPVLQNVSVTFERGKSYAIVGPNGSGKSTLVSLLAQVYDDYKGEILVNGENLRAYSEDSYQKRLALLQQEVFLFTDTVRNNITLYQPFPEEAVERVIGDARLENVIARHGEDTVLMDNGKSLSGGEKTRIAIARALLRQADVLVLDEGFAAVDEATTWEIENTILALPNRIVIEITHDLRAENLSRFDSLVFVRSGKIAGVGSYKALMSGNREFAQWVNYASPVSQQATT